MSNKHTPGPWKVTKARTVLHIASDEESVVGISLSANHVYEDYPGCKREFIERQEANARLIAAAPEMLAAIEGALRIVSLWCPNDEMDIDEDLALDSMLRKFEEIKAKVYG